MALALTRAGHVGFQAPVHIHKQSVSPPVPHSCTVHLRRLAPPGHKSKHLNSQSSIIPLQSFVQLYFFKSPDEMMTAVGFEPTHPKIVELESTALDHSAKLSVQNFDCSFFKSALCRVVCCRWKVTPWHHFLHAVHHFTGIWNDWFTSLQPHGNDFPSTPSTVLPPYALPSRRAALSDRIRSVKLNPFIGALARNKEAEPMCGGLPCHRLFLSFELPCGSLRRDMPHTSPHWGLNPGPSVYKTDALPLSYRGAHLTAQTDLQWFLFKRIRSEAIQH